jgi:hypothetical protein
VTRLHEFAPTHCAACFSQNFSLRHVDFEAAYDGPVLVAEDMRPQIDELIMCEQCLAEAAQVLGWETEDTREDRLRDQETIARLESEKTAIEEYAKKLEEVLERGRDAGRVPPAKGRPIKKPEVIHAG